MDQLPYILEYFIPGYIFIKTFQILTSRKPPKDQLVLSIVFSYIIKGICSVGHQYFFTDIVFPWGCRVAVLLFLALILSLITVVISELKFVNEIIIKINHKSIHNDIWQDVIDYNNGATMRFIYDDVMYIGVLDLHEEKGNDSWFILDDYTIEENNGDTRCSRDMMAKGVNTKLAVNLNGVKRVELYYENEDNSMTSKVGSWFKNRFRR